MILPDKPAAPAAFDVESEPALNMLTSFCRTITPDWESFLKVIQRQGTPSRVHNVELFLDGEIQAAVAERFGLGKGLDPADPHYQKRLYIEIQRFLGYDYVRATVEGAGFSFNIMSTPDSAELAHAQGRGWMPETKGPIQNWEDFEKYPWPDTTKISNIDLQWYNENLPDDMMIIGSGMFAHTDEYLCWLFGYETMCYMMYEQPDLVWAVKERLEKTDETTISRLLEIPRVKAIWGSDDMGYRGGLLLGPQKTRELVFPSHTRLAELAHAAGRPYMLHSCGNLSAVMEDLIEDVKIDAKHSFEDTIEDVRDAKRQYGDRLTLLGGIDVDFLCRSNEDAIRRRVRETIEVCQPGGGWCLGTGNSVCNYIPLDNYLVMLDEGRK